MFGFTYLVIIIVVDVFAIMDIMKTKKDQEKRILWIVIVLLAPVIGPLIYFVAGRK